MGSTAGPVLPPPLQLFRLLQKPLDFLEDCARQHGESFRLRLGVVPPVVVLSSPAQLQALFAAGPDLVDTGRGNQAFLPLLGEQSLTLLDGERHHRHRHLLMPPFHGERMRHYGALIRQIARDTAAIWQPGEAFAVRPPMQAIALEVILQAVFGLGGGERSRRLRLALTHLLDTIGSAYGIGLLLLVPMDLGPRSPQGCFRSHVEEINELIFEEIRDRRRETAAHATDILSLIAAARDETGEAMDERELRDELMTLLVAGHETTATTLAWALYWVHRLPPVYERLVAELDGLGPDPQPEAIARLPYLGAVVAETLRLYPAAIIASPRVAREPIVLDGCSYEPGTWFAACIYLAHRRATVFPEPGVFRPERFLERTYSPYEFLPFGGGHRRCIGAAFALYEMKLVLSTLLMEWRFSLAAPDDEPMLPTRRGVTVAPADHLRLLPLSRRTQL